MSDPDTSQSDLHGFTPLPAELPKRWRREAVCLFGTTTADAMQRHMLRKCAADLEFSLRASTRKNANGR